MAPVTMNASLLTSIPKLFATIPNAPTAGENNPDVVSAWKVQLGAIELPAVPWSAPVMGVWPSAATESVMAEAMSEKSEFTAAELIVVWGTNGDCGREYVPEPLRGIVVSS